VDVFSSDKAYEEDQEMTGFGMAPIKTQGASIVYDTAGQGRPRATPTSPTRSASSSPMRRSRTTSTRRSGCSGRASLAFSFRQTKENVVANLYNRGFSTSYVGADGKACSRPITRRSRATRSNTLTTAADMSEASLEDLAVQIMQATNSRGMKIALMPKKLIVPTDAGVRGDPHPQVDGPERHRQQRDQRDEGDGRLPGRREGQPLPDRHGCVLHPHQRAGGLKLFQREEADVRAGRRLRHLQPQVQGLRALQHRTGADWRVLQRRHHPRRPHPPDQSGTGVLGQQLDRPSRPRPERV
jgi:hypothetical protein